MSLYLVTLQPKHVHLNNDTEMVGVCIFNFEKINCSDLMFLLLSLNMYYLVAPSFRLYIQHDQVE